MAMESIGAVPEKSVFIGDRLETDIAGARKIGAYSVLVLSGVTGQMELRFATRNDEKEPDLVISDLGVIPGLFL
jgi:ribonucleotide monophosphatase NagD (HAD superfamily)